MDGRQDKYSVVSRLSPFEHDGGLISMEILTCTLNYDVGPVKNVEHHASDPQLLM